MADVAAEVKEDKEVVSTPEKDVTEKKVANEEDKETEENEKSESEQNGDATNGVGKEDENKETLENGDSKEPSAVKRKSDVGEGVTKVDGASPEKKAKLEEKVENGAAEATA